MCLAVPAKITKIENQNAMVDFGGSHREVSLTLVPQAKEGDYVLVHAGFAIEILNQQEAKQTLKLFEEIYGKEY